MRRTTLLCSAFVMTCAVTLTIPAVAAASERAGSYAAHAQRGAHRHMIPANAEALSPRSAPALRTFDDSDGLTRDRDECNTGCIDN